MICSMCVFYDHGTDGMSWTVSPQQTRLNVVLRLGQRRTQWTSIRTTLVHQQEIKSFLYNIKYKSPRIDPRGTPFFFSLRDNN